MKQATKRDIGKLCVFWDAPLNEDGVRVAVLKDVDREDAYPYKMGTNDEYDYDQFDQCCRFDEFDWSLINKERKRKPVSYWFITYREDFCDANEYYYQFVKVTGPLNLKQLEADLSDNYDSYKITDFKEVTKEIYEQNENY